MTNTAVVNRMPTDEQWAEAQRLFDEKLKKSQCATLTKEKHDRILELLDSWDELTPTQRRDMTNGNHQYWKSKYDASLGEGGDDRFLVLRTSGKRVVHQECLFDSIKSVHVQSECASSSPHCICFATT